MKKITRVLMSITCLVLLKVFTIGCEDKVDKNAIRQDEDRIVEYIKEKVELENKEEIRKIKFVEYEKNTSTGAWHYDVVINDKINLMFTVWRENKKVVLSFTKKGDINLIEYKKNKYESNIEVIYEK